MTHSLEVKQYSRNLTASNAYGSLSPRKGLLIRITNDQKNFGYGEICPLSPFSTETLDDCIHALQQGDHELRSVNFAIQSAHNDLNNNNPPALTKAQYAILIHSLSDLENLLKTRNNQTITAKLKIANSPQTQNPDALTSILKDHSTDNFNLRLDANTAFDLTTTQSWLNALSQLPCIDFLEQPMPKGNETLMHQLCQDYPTPIALDESATTFQDILLILDKNYSCPLVIKPSLMGYINEFKALAPSIPNPIIFSSAFETAIGIDSIIQLANDCKYSQPLGLGPIAYFNDPFSPNTSIHLTHIEHSPLTQEQKASLWNCATPL